MSNKDFFKIIMEGDHSDNDIYRELIDFAGGRNKYYLQGLLNELIVFISSKKVELYEEKKTELAKKPSLSKNMVSDEPFVKSGMRSRVQIGKKGEPIDTTEKQENVPDLKTMYYPDALDNILKLKKKIEEAIKIPELMDIEKNNPYSDIFRNYLTYLLFIDFAIQYILDPIPDYSYLYQIMRKKKYIITLTMKEFIAWMEEYGEIESLPDTQPIIKRGNFESLKNTAFGKRVEIFGRLELKYFPS